jgi:hypothetical protein
MKLCVERDSRLHEAVSRQRHAMWVRVGYKKRSVDRHKLWPTVGHMKLCVDRDMNKGRYSILTLFEITERSVTKSLWRKVEEQSIAVLQCRQLTIAPVEEQSITVLHTRQCHCSTSRTAIYRCTAQHTVPL